MKKFFVLLFTIVVSLAIVSLAFAQDVCPSGGDWQKIEWDDQDKSVTHTVPEGKIAVGACIKGGQTTEYFTSDGSNGCWSINGLGTGSVTISENWDGDDKGPECSDISHSSIELEEEEPPPEPTPPEPTPPGPTPEPTPPEPTPEPTPPPEVDTDEDFGAISPLFFITSVLGIGGTAWFFLRKKKS